MKRVLGPGMVAHTYNPVVRRISQPGQNLVSHLPPQSHLNKLGVVVHICGPSYSGSIGGELQSEASPGKNVRPYLKK
jgi:hypothetical protein